MALEMNIHFPKKQIRKEPSLGERIVICGTTSWTKKNSIKSALVSIGVKHIDFVVIGTSRGAEQLAVSVAKALGLMIFQAHPWMNANNNAIVCNKVVKLFKPTMILALNENPKDNPSTALYEKIAHKQDIPIKVITK
jgi:hypothetical protein